MTDYMICQNQVNHLLYALKHGRFWFWDKHQNKWVPSDWAAQQYAKAHTKEPDLTQEDWLGYCFGILMDDYEVPDAVGKALRALSNKEEPPCKVNTTAPNADAAVTMAAPAATLAEETSTTQADANSCPPGPCSPADASGAMSSPSGAAAACSVPVFDYSGLDEHTTDTLHWAENRIRASRRKYVIDVAETVAIVHDTLCGTVVQNLDNGQFVPKEEAFRRWCESIGISKSTAYNLLQVNVLMAGATQEERNTLASASPSLLYAAAKPSAPANLVQAVKDGDITTHKQYQDLLKENQQLRADRVNALNAAAAAESTRDAAVADLTNLHKQNRQLHDTATSAQENADAALRRAADAEQRASEAEKQLAGARQVADAARMRADKYQREAEAAKAQPVAAAVDEDEINRRAHTLADELTAPLRSELEAAKAAAATPEQIELDTRNAYDSLLLAGRAMQNAWKSVKPQLAKLPPDTRAGAINQLTNTLTEIQTEAIKCL